MNHHALVFDPDASDAERRVDLVDLAVQALGLPVRTKAVSSRNSLLSEVAQLLARGDRVTCLIDLSVGNVGSDRLGDRVVATLAGHEQLRGCVRVAWTRYAGHDVIREIIAAGAHAVIDHRRLRGVPIDDAGWRAVLSGQAQVLRRARGAHAWLPDCTDVHTDAVAGLRDVYVKAFPEAPWRDWMAPALIHIAAGRRDADILADPAIDIDGLAPTSGHRGGRVGELRDRLQGLGPSLDHGQAAARRMLHRANLLGGLTADIGERIELDGKLEDWFGDRAPIRLTAWLTPDEAALLDAVATRYADLKDAHRATRTKSRPRFVIAACTDIAHHRGIDVIDVRLAVDRALQKLRDARSDFADAPHGTVAALIRCAQQDPAVQAHLEGLRDGRQIGQTTPPVVYRAGLGLFVGGRSAAGWDANEDDQQEPQPLRQAMEAILQTWGHMSDRSKN